MFEVHVYDDPSRSRSFQNYFAAYAYAEAMVAEGHVANVFEA